MRIIIALLAALAVFSPYLASAQDSADRPISGRFILTDMDGRAVTDQAYSGKVRLVVFGYTYCPDVCPTALNTMSVALEHLGPDRAQVASLFVSVDPERDTPQHLKDYLTAFPGITGLTGSPELVAAAARNFKVRYAKQPAENGDPAAYSVDHSANFHIMDRAGNFAARLPHGSHADRLAERVRAVISGAPREN